jgi:hypothetical protein
VNVVVVIDGREAIPVRAIPLLTHWASMAPLMVAQVLAKNDGFFFGFEVLQAYFYEDGAVSPIPSVWWKNFCVRDLKALSERLESTNAGSEAQHAQWRDESLSLLPQNAFVWKDEYVALHESNWRHRLRQSEYAAWFMNKSNPKNEEVDDAEEPTPMQKIAMRRVNEEFEEWRVLNFSPVIPSTSRKNVVMEGFQRQKADTQPQVAPVMAEEIAFDMVATRQQLIDAFGTFTDMSLAWFDNLNDSPKLKAARKYAGQGGRQKAEPLFCPYEVMQWLADSKRKKGKPLSNTAAWRLLKSHFPKVYNQYSIGDPNTD